jgi:hypothetical protein
MDITVYPTTCRSSRVLSVESEAKLISLTHRHTCARPLNIFECLKKCNNLVNLLKDNKVFYFLHTYALVLFTLSSTRTSASEIIHTYAD